MFNTYLQMQALCENACASAKFNEQNGLITFKYKPNVMYNNLWNSIEGIKECRGHTYDADTGQLVIATPRKSFNYLENNTGANLKPDTPVIAYRKYNGFMATATQYKGKLEVTTTGTTNPETSWFNAEARKMIAEYNNGPNAISGLISSGDSVTFEIIHKEDPHIVDEGSARCIPLLARGRDGWITPIKDVNTLICTFGELLERKKVEQHEGWMVYETSSAGVILDYENPVKLKTDYYVYKKKLMRANAKTVKQMYRQPEFIDSWPELWQNVALAIQLNVDENIWLNMQDQARRGFIEDILKGLT
jgi:hypothetical protein